MVLRVAIILLVLMIELAPVVVVPVPDGSVERTLGSQGCARRSGGGVVGINIMLIL